jgi:hypothetical protein
MSPRTRLSRIVSIIAPACLALSVGGCASEDIQFNGGVFDAIGLSDSSKGSSGEPKVAERAPLVVPPKIDRLPAPGEAPPQSPQLAAINDPDAEAKRTQEELAREQVEYCRKNYNEHDASTDSAEGPLGPCRKSILSSINKWNSEE